MFVVSPGTSDRKMAEFEIAITVFNKSNEISGVVKSALKVKGVSCIRIIDDCSTDDSYDVLRRICAREHRVIVHRNVRNMGVSYSRNKLIELAESEFIAFVDGDDVLNSEAKSAQLAAILSGKYVFSYSDYLRGGARIQSKPYAQSNFLRGNFVPFSSVVISRELLLSNNLNFKKVHHEDYKFLVALSKVVDPSRVLYFPETTYTYARIGSGLSSNYICNLVGTYKIIREQTSFFSALYYLIFYCVSGLRKRVGK